MSKAYLSQKKIEEREKAIETFLAHITATGGDMSFGQAAQTIDYLHRKMATLCRLDYLLATVEMPGRKEADTEKKMAATEAAIKKIAEYYGFSVEFDGDPRNYSPVIFNFEPDFFPIRFYWGKEY